MKQYLVMEADINEEFGAVPFKPGDYVLDEPSDRELKVVKSISFEEAFTP